MQHIHNEVTADFAESVYFFSFTCPFIVLQIPITSFLSSKAARILNLIFIIKVIPEVGKQWFRDDESNFALACQTENNRD